MNDKIIIDTAFFEAFFFDMDGLLLDTEKLCWNCFRDVCLEYGYDPDFSIYRRCIGRGTDEGNVILKNGFSQFIPYDKVNLKWNTLYRNKIGNEPVDIKDGVFELLKTLKSKNAYMAVVTSTDTQLALKKLVNSGLKDYFSVITGGDQVKNSKPDPTIYIQAAVKAEVEPVKCIAFEDSDNGVRSALNAGMTVVQIPDLTEPSDDIRKLGHTIIRSLSLISIK